MGDKIIWGVSKDLQADVRYEPNACEGYTMDVSIGCPHHCVYCIFSLLEQKVYKLQNPKYDGSSIPMQLDNFMKRVDFPPALYLCYSSDPFGNERIADVSETVIRKLIDNNVNIMISTKGRLTRGVLDAMRIKPELIHFQMGMTSADDERNRIVEPGAPLFEERLECLKKVQEIPGIAKIGVRIDPMLPGIDDTDESIDKILSSIDGVENVVVSYVILTLGMRELWMKHDYLAKSATLLTEKTSTISERELYSLPFEQKLENLHRFRDLCLTHGKYMSTCGCKDERMKTTDLEWVCHPFNKSKRQEYIDNTSYTVEISHFDIGVK